MNVNTLSTVLQTVSVYSKRTLLKRYICTLIWRSHKIRLIPVQWIKLHIFYMLTFTLHSSYRRYGYNDFSSVFCCKQCKAMIFSGDVLYTHTYFMWINVSIENDVFSHTSNQLFKFKVYLIKLFSELDCSFLFTCPDVHGLYNLFYFCYNIHI